MHPSLFAVGRRQGSELPLLSLSCKMASRREAPAARGDGRRAARSWTAGAAGLALLLGVGLLPGRSEAFGGGALRGRSHSFHSSQHQPSFLRPVSSQASRRGDAHGPWGWAVPRSLSQVGGGSQAGRQGQREGGRERGDSLNHSLTHSLACHPD